LGTLLYFVGPPAVRAIRSNPARAFEPAADAVLYDRIGSPIQLWPEQSDPRPIVFEDLSPNLVKAVMAREDQRFFSHFGVDPVAVARAVRADLAAGRIVQGGSTLTMQLVERAFETPERTVVEQLRAKVYEALMAARLEWAAFLETGSRREGKERILAAYLSHVEFGNQTVGIREAADYYFRKSPAKLTLGESAYLAGLIRGPSVNNAHHDPDNARRARDAVILNMEKLGQLSSRDLREKTFYVSSERPKRTRHGDGFLSAAVRRELQSLVETGDLTPEEAASTDLGINLSRHSGLQGLAEESLLRQLRKIESDRGFSASAGDLQGSVVVIANHDGSLLASVGGRDFDSLSYDCALQARRTAASVAKPFLYAAYLEEGGRHIGDLVSNEVLGASEVPGLAGPRAPDETTLLKGGKHPLWKGLAYSSNRMTLQVGANTRHSTWASLMHKMRVVRGPIPLTTNAWLGTFDAKPVDLAAAYATFARRGSYTEPYLIHTIEIGGRTVFERQAEAFQVMRSSTADEITAALREVIREGTASASAGGGEKLALNRDVAGKTGTSDGVFDAWFIGYGSDVTVAVWIGFPEGNRTVLKGATGASLAFPVWRSIMEGLPSEFEFAPLAELPISAERVQGTQGSRSST